MRVKHQSSEFRTSGLVLVETRVSKCRNRPPKSRSKILYWKVRLAVRKVWEPSLRESLFDPFAPPDWEEGISGMVSLAEDLGEARGEFIDNLLGVIDPLRLPLTHMELYHETTLIQNEVAMVRCILQLMYYLNIVAKLGANWNLIKHTEEEVP